MTQFEVFTGKNNVGRTQKILENRTIKLIVLRAKVS